MSDDQNRTEKIEPLNPRSARHTDTSGSGNVAQDGYRRLYRRPRTMMTDEILPSDQADRIEAFDRAMHIYGGMAPMDIDEDGDAD